MYVRKNGEYLKSQGKVREDWAKSDMAREYNKVGGKKKRCWAALVLGNKILFFNAPATVSRREGKTRSP